MWFWISIFFVVLFVVYQFIDTSGCDHEYKISGAGFTVCKKCGRIQ